MTFVVMSLDLLELATGGDGTLLRFFLGFLLTGPWFSSSCLLGIFLTFCPFGTGNGRGTVRCWCGSFWLDHDLCRHVYLGLVGLATRWDCTLRILEFFSAYLFFWFWYFISFQGFLWFLFLKREKTGFLDTNLGSWVHGTVSFNLGTPGAITLGMLSEKLNLLGLPYDFMGLGLWEVFLVLGSPGLVIVVSCEGFSCIIYV